VLDCLPSCACPADHVEVVARLWRGVWVDSLHQLLEDHQGGQAAHAATVEREQAQVAAGHGVYASDGRSRRITEVESWDGTWCLFYMLEVASSWHCGAAFSPPVRAAEARLCRLCDLAAASHACLVGEAERLLQVDAGVVAPPCALVTFAAPRC
jgi:hypothetical protein